MRGAEGSPAGTHPSAARRGEGFRRDCSNRWGAVEPAGQVACPFGFVSESSFPPRAILCLTQASYLRSLSSQSSDRMTDRMGGCKEGEHSQAAPSAVLFKPESWLDPLRSRNVFQTFFPPSRTLSKKHVT